MQEILLQMACMDAKLAKPVVAVSDLHLSYLYNVVSILRTCL